ncbi:hypothetical protein MNV49_006879 [Pseudohyphozyma bogoriensis]|nr:hypothetical protein MNV49_006879 [Pseudohyphozyma bogoriensis]
MLSLPSQDQPHYYSPSPSPPGSPTPTTAPASNRGNKLHPAAPHIRRGRLGAYPHTDTGFTSPKTSQQNMLEGHLPPSAGFAVAPNLHLLLPPYTSSIPDGVLPTPPATPLELLQAPEVQRTLGGKNKVFRTLGMSATGLIEQEGGLVGNLNRVCAGLRGEGFDWRWDGDDKTGERRRERERIENEKREKVIQEAKERERAEKGLPAAEVEVNGDKEGDKAAEEKVDEKKENQVEPKAELENGDVAPDQAASGDASVVPTPNGTSHAPTPVDSTVATPSAVPTPAEPTVTNGTEAPAPTSSTTELAAPEPVSAVDAGTNTDADVVANMTLPPLPSLPPLPPIATDGDVEMAEAGAEANVGGTGTQGEDEDGGSEEAQQLRRRSGRVATRTTTDRMQRSTSGCEEGREEDEEEEEELPEFARRLVDPEVYVRSLFVSEEHVELVVPIPSHNGGPPTMGTDLFSPNEQEVLVHDCLTDLHKFLADSLEYRARLAEIRDGVLGVERRRKGMWKVLRTLVASEYLDVEEEEL